MEDIQGKYTPGQLGVMQKAYVEITSKFETGYLSKLTPKWFIPWYELIIDEWTKVGEGGFGSVYRAKWLDSDVVVKRVILAGSGCQNGTTTFHPFQSSLSDLTNLSATPDHTNTARHDALVMVRREVDIWFGFSHPHVVRLFGACYVGRPFFVCEYATNGTLVSYLRKYPDQLCLKLHEAALGVQYLHARKVVHGDLKRNNIVIGSDMKAKVTDFGLSSIASSEFKPLVSAAWHWVAPECFPPSNSQPQDQSKTGPTFALDVYSLGMCIVEALRVVDAVKSGRNSRYCLP